MSPQQLSSTKTRLKCDGVKEDGIERGRGRPKSIESILSPPKTQPAPAREGDLLAALEAIKPLVASLVAEKVKRRVDLLG